MSSRIRKAVGDDLRRLEPLVAACIEPAWSGAALGAALAAPGARAWVADADAEGTAGSLVGFVLARAIVDVLEIDLVGVAPARRRGGLARRLLEATLEAARGEGLREAHLELSVGNAPAAGLYEGLGFVVVGRRPRYYPDGSDALLLTRALA